MRALRAAVGAIAHNRAIFTPPLHSRTSSLSVSSPPRSIVYPRWVSASTARLASVRYAFVASRPQPVACHVGFQRARLVWPTCGMPLVHIPFAHASSTSASSPPHAVVYPVVVQRALLVWPTCGMSSVYVAILAQGGARRACSTPIAARCSGRHGETQRCGP